MTKQVQDLRAQSNEELYALRDAKKAEIFNIKSAFACRDKKAKPSELRAGRKTVARILTILRERELRPLS